MKEAVYVLGGLLALWIVARLLFTAYFLSRQQYEEWKENHVKR